MSDPNPQRSRRARPPRVLTMTGAVLALVLLASACINNGTWVAAPSPVAPVQALDTTMADVSCVTEDWCLAVGSMGFYPLAEVWDGSTWSVITAPSLAGLDNTAPRSVACGTSTSCIAKVTRVYPSADIAEDIVAWDGEQWSVLTGAEDAGYVDTLPYACAPDGTCLIVDNRSDRTIVWDGDSATVIPFSTTSPPSAVGAIDCFSADLCVAGASYSTAVWNGTSWSTLVGSNTSAIFSEGPGDIACSTVDNCVAVGPLNTAETGPTSATWNGSTWTEVALPAGVTSTGDLDCIGTSECLLPVSGGPSAGMLAWNGSAWVGAPSPADTWAISCLPLWCLGVGSTGTPATPTAATYEWTNS
jgi:hypothetical protein